MKNGGTDLDQNQEKVRKKRLKRLYFKTLFISLAVLAGLIAAAYGTFTYMLSGMNRSAVDISKLSVNEDLERYGGNEIANIVFYGIDSRNHDYTGLSDAIMVVSIDKRDAEIKLVSIARDTYVSVPGYHNTKINHAYLWGGPELAIKTLNENFDMDITDYVTVNFDSLADIIDAVGGIDLEVSEAEREQINAYLLKGPRLEESGMVHLTGPQAVSYSRIRKIDSDDMRTQRQRKVLSLLFEKALDISPLKYPSYIKKFAPIVETSLTNDEILRIASVGMKSGLKLEQASFPNDYIKSGGERIDGMWYYVYDIEQASDMLHQFIYNDIPFEEYAKHTGASMEE